MLEDRLWVYSKYRKLLTIRAKALFHMMLSQRGYSGKMKLEHKKEELHLSVGVCIHSTDYVTGWLPLDEHPFTCMKPVLHFSRLSSFLLAVCGNMETR